jgi:hypothetical protein
MTAAAMAELLRRLEAGEHPTSRVCAWCRRVHRPESDDWVELELGDEVLVSHGICPRCDAALLAPLQARAHQDPRYRR